MTERVRIDTKGISPFRVTEIGVDLSGAQFNNLLFDANAKPLRLQSTGYAQAPPIYVNQAGLAGAYQVSSFSAPSGQYPLFMSNYRRSPQGSQADGVRSLGYAGVALNSNDTVWIINSIKNLIGDDVGVLINWCLFKNYG